MKPKQCPKCRRNILTWDFRLKKYICKNRDGYFGCGYIEHQKGLGGFL